MILVIDNYDSFTYNLYQYLAHLEEVIVYRNDKITIDKIREFKPDHVVISPGPGRPDNAGISNEVIDTFKKEIPILGVCLGHQCIAEVFGAKIIKAIKPQHGKVSNIYLTEEDDSIMKNVVSPYTATRYHSLIVERKSLPNDLLILAESDEKEIMALKHKKYPIYGLQFHPESIMTGVGMNLIENFVRNNVQSSGHNI